MDLKRWKLGYYRHFVLLALLASSMHINSDLEVICKLYVLCHSRRPCFVLFASTSGQWIKIHCDDGLTMYHWIIYVANTKQHYTVTSRDFPQNTKMHTHLLKILVHEYMYSRHSFHTVQKVLTTCFCLSSRALRSRSHCALLSVNKPYWSVDNSLSSAYKQQVHTVHTLNSN